MPLNHSDYHHIMASLKPLRDCHIGEMQPQTDYVMALCLHISKDSSFPSTSASGFQWMYFASSTFTYCSLLYGFNGSCCEHDFPLRGSSPKDSSCTSHCQNFCTSLLSCFIVIVICFELLSYIAIVTRTFIAYIVVPTILLLDSKAKVVHMAGSWSSCIQCFPQNNSSCSGFYILLALANMYSTNSFCNISRQHACP